MTASAKPTQRSDVAAGSSLNTWADLLITVPTVATRRPYAVVTILLVLLALVAALVPDQTITRDTRQ